MFSSRSIANLISAANDAPQAFEAECMKQFSSLAQALGLPRSRGQIYGLLFASARPLSFTYILEQLGFSKGSVRQGVNALRKVRAIMLVTAQDIQREHFAPDTKLRKLIVVFLHGSIISQLNICVKRLERFEARHGAVFSTEGEVGYASARALGQATEVAPTGQGRLAIHFQVSQLVFCSGLKVSKEFKFSGHLSVSVISRSDWAKLELPQKLT